MGLVIGNYIASVTPRTIVGGGPIPNPQKTLCIENYILKLTAEPIVGGGSPVITGQLHVGTYTAPVTPVAITGTGPAPITDKIYVIGNYIVIEPPPPIIVIPPPVYVPHVDVKTFRTLLTEALSNMDFGYEPTSIYLDGVQTFEYVIQEGRVYFNNTIDAGVVLTAIPPEAVKFINDEPVEITITQTGVYSIFSDPFGAMLFSLDEANWVNSLTHTFPALLYAKPRHTEPVTDFKCRANIEIVIWRGTDDTYVNEDGRVVVPSGGVEYHVF